MRGSAAAPGEPIWMGYREACGPPRLLLPPGGPRLEHYTTTTAGANGPRSDKSIFLGFDARGRLWAGTDHGVDVYDHKAWRHYGRSDGLIWDDCNSHAFLADPDGVIWIGTSRRLSRFQASLSPAAPVPPPVVVTEVKLGDRRVDLQANYDVPYAANSLQVRFAALTFLQESSVLFRYRMTGVRRDWVE